jgi:hypothetical protein
MVEFDWSVRSETWVTERSGDMGYTFRPAAPLTHTPSATYQAMAGASLTCAMNFPKHGSCSSIRQKAKNTFDA